MMEKRDVFDQHIKLINELATDFVSNVVSSVWALLVKEMPKVFSSNLIKTQVTHHSTHIFPLSSR